MAEPKTTTLLQRLGFQDSDLKTTTHDEMILKLSNDKSLFYLSRVQRVN